MQVRFVHVDPLDIADPKRFGDFSGKRMWRSLIPSIKQHGIVNPVILWATQGELRIHYGITRVQAAVHLALPSLPAVVCDMDNRFPDAPVLSDVKEIAAKWVVPEDIEPHLNLSETKLWMNHHPRVPIDENGEYF